MISGVCVYWVYSGKHQARTDGYHESGAFLLIYCMYDYLQVSIWLSIYIINHLL